jgi:hypothetical protein
MIDLVNVWLPQILSYAVAISESIFEKAWMGDVTVKTSVTTFPELIEQIFGDLDSDNMMRVMTDAFGNVDELVESVSLFLESLTQTYDYWIEKGEPLSVEIIQSTSWRRVVESAISLTKHSTRVRPLMLQR